MKNWYQSKTIWANIIVIITAVGAGFSGDITWQNDIPVITSAVINLALRFVTTSAIASSTTPN